jgi:hypothetical protein
MELIPKRTEVPNLHVENPTDKMIQPSQVQPPLDPSILNSQKGDEIPQDLGFITEQIPKKKKRGGRRKINIEYIPEKNRRHITFSKRKGGLMKKAYELSTLTGTQVILLVASETGHVYTFATPKLQALITKPEGKNLIQQCLNSTEGDDDHHHIVPEGTYQPQQQMLDQNQQMYGYGVQRVNGYPQNYQQVMHGMEGYDMGQYQETMQQQMQQNHQQGTMKEMNHVKDQDVEEDDDEEDDDE